MKILLLRPDPGHEKFGLGPFFRVEPLGLEYIGAALLAAGYQVTVADLRFRPGATAWVRRTAPRIVGISCLHALEYDRIIATAAEVRRLAPDAFIIVGGHAAAAYPAPLEHDLIDAVCLDDGEEVLPALAKAIDKGMPLTEVPALRLKTGNGWVTTQPLPERTSLDLIRLPARHLVERHRSGYHCLLFKPVWLVETARGCPHRCSFCSVWQFYGRTCRERSLAAVVEDFAATGDSIFVADDLFWYDPERSLELAQALKKRGVYKRWILVQTRTDLITKRAEVMAAWRPLARDFDIFLGLEAASDSGLEGIAKDSEVTDSVEAVRMARELRYGINGNFLVSHDWDEEQFSELWEFVAHYGLQRAGFTVLTPLPGTEFYEEIKAKIPDQPWSNFDMHHLLWEPKLGTQRFFELYAETWKRSILNTSGEKSLLDWVRQVKPSQWPYIVRVLWQTQRMMKPEAYLTEHALSRAPLSEPAARRPSVIARNEGGQQ
ncbi:putative methyltransferase [Geobacter sp. OR-1]|uniref:B12-binding domain-containing radical SAM protein n=1 Tax=Geobacter sp. OR-1 TaxID=1266765 RepID=UPI0005430BA0|nr:radical SAM protein [Geobacter sp. OR-1]GAM08853.1 putative methyltransferase [Geobacter sp. OR-1]